MSSVRKMELHFFVDAVLLRYVFPVKRSSCHSYTWLLIAVCIVESRRVTAIYHTHDARSCSTIVRLATTFVARNGSVPEYNRIVFGAICITLG